MEINPNYFRKIKIWSLCLPLSTFLDSSSPEKLTRKTFCNDTCASQRKHKNVDENDCCILLPLRFQFGKI